ncbi:30S ribosomal protein S19e [Candidatus Woesearchaeota archaeon]|nr:30S ribosomal protein S19e [Candidatus Woesearchaeota archaeon]
MAKMLEVNPNELIEKVADELEKLPEIKAPDWASFIKTGRHKQRPPAREDWWQVRAAAMLRSVARLGPIGVSKIRVKYGGKKNRGHKPEHAYKGSGSIARKILQQLEKAGLVRQAQKGLHKGRIITQKATQIMNKAAEELSPTKQKEAKPAKEETASKQKV